MTQLIKSSKDTRSSVQLPTIPLLPRNYVEENEPEERLLNRFRREVMRAGVIQECKRRRFFENKQEEKKRKSREAAKRKSRSRFVPSFLQCF